MKFSLNQKDLQQSLSYCQSVIEKRSTLQILSNVLLDASNSKLKITATDLDLIFINEIKNVEIAEEGKTTTTSLVANILVHAGLDPTVINGGIINSLKNSKNIFIEKPLCINNNELIEIEKCIINLLIQKV